MLTHSELMRSQRKVYNTNSPRRKSGNFKVCAYWVSWKLAYLEKEIVTTDLLHQYHAGGEGCLSQIVMGVKPGSIILNLNPSGGW